MKISSFLQRKFLLSSMLIIVCLWGCNESFIEPAQTEPDLEKSAVANNIAPMGVLPSGALYEIVLPVPVWNSLPKRILLLYTPGYEDADHPLELPDDMIENVYIKDFIVNKGMGYASTSYRSNGLVVVDAVEDILMMNQMIHNFFLTNPQFLPPDALVLAGPSEGGLVTVLTIEKYPGLFHAALATCCPIGDFYKQLQYYGDAHVLFKYFFGPSLDEINLGSPKGISKATLAAWESGALPAAIAEVLNNDYLYNGGNKIRQFVNCAKIPVDINNRERTIQVILEVIRYPIKATNDAIERMGGNPYNNKYPKREYIGSDNDRKLNLTVERIKRKGWETATQTVYASYETTGVLLTPLITVHRLNDHITFYEHQLEYTKKVNANSPFPDLLMHIPVPGDCYHCTFTIEEIEAALSLLSAIL